MAVHAASGTLTASTVATVTLTSWQKFVSVTLTGNGTAAPCYITVDGSTPTIGGADETAVQVPAAGSVTYVLKNLTPKPELTTTTPGATDPSAVPALVAPNTVVKLISAQALPYNVQFAADNAAATVLS